MEKKKFGKKSRIQALKIEVHILKKLKNVTIKVCYANSNIGKKVSIYLKNNLPLTLLSLSFQSAFYSNC